MESSNEISVQQLLGDLIKIIYRDCIEEQQANAQNAFISAPFYQKAPPTTIPAKLLRTFKTRANAILLHKTQKQPLPADLLATSEGFSEIIDPIREMKYCQFVNNIHVGQMRPLMGDYSLLSEREKRCILVKHDLYTECIESIDSDDYFRLEQSDGNSILKFLLALKNSCPEDPSKYGGKSIFSLEDYKLPALPKFEPKFFKLKWDPVDEMLNNPYCQSIRKLNEATGMFAFCMPSTSATPHNPPSLTSDSQLAPTTSSPKKTKRCTVFLTAATWKHRGLRIPLDDSAESDALLASLVEKKFITETIDGSMNAAGFLETKRYNDFICRVMEEELFIKHVKLMLIGIESDSFTYDANTMSFRMLEHLTPTNILPATAEKFVDVFIESGTCFKRLKCIVQRNTSNQKEYHGFLFKVCGA